MTDPSKLTVRRFFGRGANVDDGLDPLLWGPPPTRWQLLTARLWQAWLKARRGIGKGVKR